MLASDFMLGNLTLDIGKVLKQFSSRSQYKIAFVVSPIRLEGFIH